MLLIKGILVQIESLRGCSCGTDWANCDDVTTVGKSKI